MPLVKVKTKHQITLPVSVREKAGVAVGDLLEAKVEGKRITLTPQSVIDRSIAQGLKDFDEGRALGPFKSAKAAIRALHRAARSRRRR